MDRYLIFACASLRGMAIGPGAGVRIPMSIAIIGGVIVSTFFTLFVVPCVYSLFTGLEHHKKT